MMQTTIKTLESNKKQAQGVEIFSTTDYDQFKTVLGNRSIHQPHLRRLILSIEKNNLLPENPILVNEKMEVIDGQHRLLAAKALGLSIYYMIAASIGLEETQMLNANNRSWLTQDYLNAYIAIGKKDYIRLNEFANEYRISIPIAIRILGGLSRNNGTALRKFRDGLFVIEDYEYAERLASLIGEVRRHSPDTAFTHKPCVRALDILLTKIGDPKIFTDQLQRYQQVITRRPSIKDYLLQFENIINANRTGKVITLS